MDWSKVFLIVVAFWGISLLASPLDSIGTEVKNGKTYIKHKIVSGETLYRLTKKYGVSIDELKEQNPGIDKSFKEGNVVLVPSKKAIPSTPKNDAPKQKVASSDDASVRYHIVESGQGLFAIAKMYQLRVDELKNLNGLESNDVKVGQKLIVSKGATNAREDVSAESKNVDNEEVKEEQTKVRSVTVPQKSVAAANPLNKKIMDTIKVRNVKKTEGPLENNFNYGVAILNNANDKSDRYEAYFDLVEPGTFINVKNLSNGETVFVNVVGKLPKQADPKIIITISQTAMERLKSAENKIAVEVKYVAP